MLIIHTAYAERRFFIWGERSFETDEIKDEKGTDPSAGEVNMTSHPWDAGVPVLEEALRRIGVRVSRRRAASDDGIDAFVALPSRGNIPIPSSPLLGEVPKAKDGAGLAEFKVSALRVSLEDLLLMSRILDRNEEKLSVPGLLFAYDAAFVSKALEYASLMALRGNFIPDMRLTDKGYTSVWKPLHLAKYQDEYISYLNGMPPVLRGFSLKQGQGISAAGEYIAEEILETLLDDIVRAAQITGGSKGKKVDPDNPHDIWLRSLAWPCGLLDKWSDAMEALYPQVRAWADSLKTMTLQPWRLFIRLEEPIPADDDGGNGKSWTLSWHLQSTRDPSLIIPASKAWSPGAAERRLFDYTGVNPRRYMLQILGRLASIVPAIAKSLDGPAPVECSLDPDELFEFLNDHVPGILDQGIQIQFPSSWAASRPDRTKLAVKGRVIDEPAFSPGGGIDMNDLLEVDWSVSLDGDVLTEDELELLTNLKAPLVKIRGKWVLLRREDIDAILSGMKKLPERIGRREALLYSVSESWGDVPLAGIMGSAWLDAVRSVLTGRDRIEDIAQPEGFKGNLRPYQVRGFSWLVWLAKLGLGGCLADDMGLGKTVQTLALLQHLMLSGERRPVLLICPTSVIENWRREAERFVPGLSVMVHHGSGRLKGDKFAEKVVKNATVISSYALLQRDCAVFSRMDWAGVVLDEAQNIKNPETYQARAARSIKADWRIALTGTPVENHAGDMWAIMEFLMPGLLPNRAKFIREFLYPIQAGEQHAMDRLRRITGPFILRRLKTDKSIINDLPEKIESEVFCPLSREQASLYSAVLGSLDEAMSGAEGIRRKGIILAAITSLKQICDHPALYLKDGSNLSGRSGKLARLAELAEEMLSAKDKMLIFTQYAEMGSLLKKFLQENFGREVLFLHGGVPREKRDEMVARFQGEAEAPPFFVLSLKAGGTGLNLTSANQVIMFDRWWNPAVEQQAVDRAYRIGQKNSVHVHYFCCKGTFEEKIERLIESKKQIADALVGTGENWLSELSEDELRELFALDYESVEDIK